MSAIYVYNLCLHPSFLISHLRRFLSVNLTPENDCHGNMPNVIKKF